MRVVSEYELPADPDLDDLPDELVTHHGPMKIVGEDEDGNVWEMQITREELAVQAPNRSQRHASGAAIAAENETGRRVWARSWHLPQLPARPAA
jgi:hypothetical protein